MRAPLSSELAMDQVDFWLRQPAVTVISPGPGHALLMRNLLRDSGTAGNLTNDAHLAALAIENDADVVSFDRDFARFRGVRWTVPTP